MRGSGLRVLSRALTSISSRSQAVPRGAVAVATLIGARKQSTAAFLSRPAAENKGWSNLAYFLPAAAATAFIFSNEAEASQLERTFIAIKPDGVQRGLISEIIGRFERKGYKLVGIKVIIPTKKFAEAHYDDLKNRPFFNGLTDFLSSGPVIAMVWEGEGVISYGRKLIGATSPQASAPGTIRGDLAVIVGRNIIHGSDGPETAVNEIALWFKPDELVKYKLDSEKWIYEK